MLTKKEYEQICTAIDMGTQTVVQSDHCAITADIYYIEPIMLKHLLSKFTSEETKKEYASSSAISIVHKHGTRYYTLPCTYCEKEPDNAN